MKAASARSSGCVRRSAPGDGTPAGPLRAAEVGDLTPGAYRHCPTWRWTCSGTLDEEVVWRSSVVRRAWETAAALSVTGPVGQEAAGS